MSIKNNKRVMLVVFMIISMMVHTVSVHAAALGSITLTGDWLSAGHVFYIYKIADLKNNQLSSANDLYTETVNNLGSNSEAWREAVSELSDVIEKNSVSATATAYSAAGSVSFSGLGLGLYMITGESFKSGNTTYSPAATLISVPSRTDAADYVITAELKKTVKEDKNPTSEENKKTTTNENNNNGGSNKQHNKKTTEKVKKDTANESGNGENNGNKSKTTMSKTTKSSANATSKSISTQSIADAVKTSDATKIGIYVVLLILSALILIWGVMKIRRKE